MQLKDIVKNHRKQAELSQKALADLAGVGKTVVFDIEHGKATVRLDKLVQVLKVLNIRFSYTSGINKESEEVELW